MEDPLAEVQHLASRLDSTRGCLLSSSYEYPGRRFPLVFSSKGLDSNDLYHIMVWSYIVSGIIYIYI